jgi:hypothetical protein
MASRWVTLFQGTIPEVLTLQASCESIGIPTYVPDMSLIQADPFMRGGNALALELLVPADRLEDARAFRKQLAEELRSDPEFAAPEVDPLELLGKRVRWCIVLLLTAPLGIWLGLRYLAAVRGLARKPAEHAWTVGSFWACVLLTASGAVVYGRMLLES